MRGLPEAETTPTTRIRRWDAVVVGSSLPGLVAAVRLGMRRARVLVIEEEAATQRFPGLREPFFLGASHKESVLGAGLRALGVPLIDQRRIEHDPLAFQIVLPDARVDMGEPHLCVDEWVAWGLAKPDEARALVRALDDASRAERDALLAAPVVRGSRRKAAPTATDTPPLASEPRPRRRSRGLPAEWAAAPPGVRRLLEAQVRVLASLGAAEPSPHARARLLGASFEGCGVIRGREPWLRDILRRRIEALYGEFRSVQEDFRLVAAGGQPGLAPDLRGESGEVWVGRALILNAALPALAAAVRQTPVPEVLQAPPARHRRVSVHLRAEPETLPVGMAGRVVLAGEGEPATLRSFVGSSGGVELVASRVAETGPDAAPAEDALVAAVSGLMPFAEGRLARVAAEAPRWDDDALLAEPPPGSGWPGEYDVRAPTRQPIYRLDRAALGGLGLEGDLLLGWRGGDAVAADLA